MGTPAAGLSQIAGDGEEENDEGYEAKCEHRLTMVPSQMQHCHENPTMLGAQGLNCSFYCFYRMDSRRSAQFCNLVLPRWLFLAACKAATPPAAWPARREG